MFIQRGLIKSILAILTIGAGASQTDKFDELLSKYLQELSSPAPKKHLEQSFNFHKQIGSFEPRENFQQWMQNSGIDFQYSNFLEEDNKLFSENIFVKEYINFERNNAESLKKDKVRWILNEVFKHPRNHEYNEDVKASIGLFIWWIMGRRGNVMGLQIFKPRQFTSLFHNKQVLGTNIISIIPGRNWGTSLDKIVVIGAHWDTVKDSPGFEDNGSGVTALIEIHEQFSVLQKLERNNTVIFVAFDLEEYGSQGSLVFVQDFLIPSVIKRFNQADFQGAYILDSIMNFNASENSQEIDKNDERVTPEYFEFVKTNRRRGDFLLLVGRIGEEENLLKAFESDAKMTKIRLTKGDNSLNQIKERFDYLRSDHVRFWYSGLPAVLVTDTGHKRGIMQQCYHSFCDHPSTNTTLSPFADLKFLERNIFALKSVINKAAFN